MKSSSKKQTKIKNSQPSYDWGEQPLECKEIQEVLPAYMSRELGEAQSILIHEHLRKCETCRAEAAEIEETLALLKSSNTPDYLRLSDDRRKRILLAVFHPAINWIDLHHKLVSIVLAVIVLATAILTLRNFAIFRDEPLEDSIPIWRYFKTGELPELVEQQLKEASEDGGAEDKSQKPEVRGTE